MRTPPSPVVGFRVQPALSSCETPVNASMFELHLQAMVRTLMHSHSQATGHQGRCMQVAWTSRIKRPSFRTVALPPMFSHWLYDQLKLFGLYSILFTTLHLSIGTISIATRSVWHTRDRSVTVGSFSRNLLPCPKENFQIASTTCSSPLPRLNSWLSSL